MYPASAIIRDFFRINKPVYLNGNSCGNFSRIPCGICLLTSRLGLSGSLTFLFARIPRQECGHAFAALVGNDGGRRTFSPLCPLFLSFTCLQVPSICFSYTYCYGKISLLLLIIGFVIFKNPCPNVSLATLC